MENSNEDSRRMMCIGRFTYRWAYQYYTVSGGKLRKFTGDKLHWYAESQIEFYFKSEETEAWEKIKKRHHQTKTKQVIMKDQNIEHMSDSGYSMVDKDGNVLKEYKRHE